MEINPEHPDHPVNLVNPVKNFSKFVLFFWGLIVGLSHIPCGIAICGIAIRQRLKARLRAYRLE
ncbi:MAG: hypothetical protein ACREOO_25885 [bacterium]